MSVFSKRSVDYKAGICLLLSGFALFVLGFASPEWTKSVAVLKTEKDTENMYDGVFTQLANLQFRGHNGLWINCLEVNHVMHCLGLSHSLPAWFSAVLGLQCLALIGLVASCCYAVVINWMQVHPAHNRLVEVIALVSGMLGFIGAVIYMKTTSWEGPGNLPHSWEHYDDGVAVEYTTGHLSWAFAVDMAGCVLVMIAAVIVALSSHSLKATMKPEVPSLSYPIHQHPPVPYLQDPMARAPAPPVNVYIMPQAAVATPELVSRTMPPPYQAVQDPVYPEDPNVQPSSHQDAFAAAAAVATSHEYKEKNGFMD